MKTIGLIGGLSWESSAEYYRIINERVREKLGDLHSAKSIMISVDFYEIQNLVREDHSDKVGEILVDAAKKLELAGADVLLICANTAHRFADKIQKNIKISFLHIADKTAEKIVSANINKVALLGTRFTMEEPFYKERLSHYKIETLIPNEQDRGMINEIIFKELCMGVVKRESKEKFQAVIQDLKKKGAQGVILGCTEMWMLIKSEDCSIPIFDTARIHAEAAVDYALIRLAEEGST